MTGRAEDAEDVVQDTFIRAFRQLDRFEARANFGTWLYRIAFNCAVDYTRSRHHRDRPDSLDVVEQVPAAGVPTAHDLAYAGEIEDCVQRALEALSAQERAAFVMRHFEGCTIDEICRTLDIRTNAAKHAVFRAVRKMRVALGPLVAGRMQA
jgi:RNA polymerase sigma-70 factor (ECF subfamily)